MGVDYFICSECYEPHTEYSKKYCLCSSDKFSESLYKDLNKEKFQHCKSNRRCKTCNFHYHMDVLCYDCYIKNNGLCKYHIKLFKKNKKNIITIFE